MEEFCEQFCCKMYILIKYLLLIAWVMHLFFYLHSSVFILLWIFSYFQEMGFLCQICSFILLETWAYDCSKKCPWWLKYISLQVQVGEQKRMSLLTYFKKEMQNNSTNEYQGIVFLSILRCAAYQLVSLQVLLSALCRSYYSYKFWFLKWLAYIVCNLIYM